MNDKEKKISAFMQLYKPVQRQLAAYCRVLAGNEEVASDLLQDTLLAAFENFESLHKVNSFIYYLCGIARNKYLKQQRRWKFFGKEQEIKQQNLEISHDTIELQPDIELLYKAIAKLNTEQRDVLLMFHIMGFSLIDIQNQLGLSEAAVKNRLVRARNNLKQMLSDNERPIAVNLSKIGLL